MVSESGGPFDACLIAGAFNRRRVEASIAVAVPHLTPGAVLGFHDYGDPAYPDVKQAVDAAAARSGWRLVCKADYLGVFTTED